MKLGALIITTGLSEKSGIDVLLPSVGAIPAGQRMIAAFQSAGVTMIGLVVEKENKKAERTFAQDGVFFLHGQEQMTLFQGMQMGLSFLEKHCDRIFVVTGDTPLFQPETLHQMLKNNAPMVVPEYKHVCGFPVLLKQEIVPFLLGQPTPSTLEDLLMMPNLGKELVSVTDPAILLHGADMTHRNNLIQCQNAQLLRPTVGISLQKEHVIYDVRFSTLLHLVEETHSVRDACALMQISYSTAWNMLNQAEDELGFPFLNRARGGSSGSGSLLTEKGKQWMDAYDRYSEHLLQIANALYQESFLEAILPEIPSK